MKINTTRDAPIRCITRVYKKIIKTSLHYHEPQKHRIMSYQAEDNPQP